jgi:hypothetical protein
VDEFLGARGFHREAAGVADAPAAAAAPATPLEFVCEDDVRRALEAGRTLLVSARAIVTPAARDLGEQHGVFTLAP